eukprot:g4186.t1
MYRPGLVFFATDVPGVLDHEGRTIPTLQQAVLSPVPGQEGVVDVTGGMRAKVDSARRIASQLQSEQPVQTISAVLQAGAAATAAASPPPNPNSNSNTHSKPNPNHQVETLSPANLDQTHQRTPQRLGMAARSQQEVVSHGGGVWIVEAGSEAMAGLLRGEAPSTATLLKIEASPRAAQSRRGPATVTKASTPVFN